MKEFNLELAKKGHPVCTRDGKFVRIICFDVKGTDYPIVAAIMAGDVEYINQYPNSGKYCADSHASPGDLMMASEVKESEDEKLKEQVVYAINQLHVCECTKNKLIAWLEKQDTKVSVYRDTLFKIATVLSQYEDKDDSPLEKIRSIMIDGTICSMDLESKKKECGEQKPTDEEMKILLQTEYEKGKADAIEQKSAWSEEDENRFRNLIYLVEHSDEGSGTKRGFIKFINRLKDLKERYTWKPSEGQMSALSKAIAFVFDSNSDVKHSLESLYNELKKL